MVLSLLLTFLHSCKIKSGGGLGTRLGVHTRSMTLLTVWGIKGPLNWGEHKWWTGCTSCEIKSGSDLGTRLGAHN